ncbi:hypothetical protein IV102_01750 [bacterium]|nr:hypothetical protein [bacterium]
MSELEAFLAEQAAYQSAGRGTFTVDPARQRELLGRLGLAQSELGFVKLAQGACQSGAAQLDLVAESNSLTVSFHPTRAPRQPLWEGEALALSLLSLSQEYELDWSWTFDGCRVTGQARDHHFTEAQSVAALGQAANHLEVRISKSRKSWWHRSWTAAVHKLLARRLMGTPMTATWNGQPLTQPLRLSARAEAFVYSPPQESGGLWLPIQSSASLRRTRCGGAEGEAAQSLADPLEVGNQPGYRGWAALGATGASWSETIFVLDGVALEKESNLLDRPGIVAVVSATGLNADLGGLHLIHDQAFRDRLQSLRGEVRWLDAINQTGR